MLDLEFTFLMDCLSRREITTRTVNYPLYPSLFLVSENRTMNPLPPIITGIMLRLVLLFIRIIIHPIILEAHLVE